MTTYTFLWNNESWKRKDELARSTGDRHIDYIAGDAKKPLVNFVAGDEIFVITVRGGNLYIGGRLIVNSSPVTKAQAVEALGRKDLIDKDRYVLATRDRLDIFRPATLVDLDDAKSLELYTSTGESKKPDLDEHGGIDRQTFRSPYRLTAKSASVLRGYLQLSPSEDSPKATPAIPPKFPLDPLKRKRTPVSPEQDDATRKKQVENGAKGLL
jgi:hypothetical protein